MAFPLVAIVGPTGSGKSSLGLQIAEKFGGEVVNCDALQVYRGFDIGTAKTPVAERRGVRHHLIDVLDPVEIYSAGDYARDARCAVGEISGRGRLPVVIGGTGFYLRALLDGLPPLPARDEELRTRLMRREARRPGSLHRLLHRLEPAASSRIHEHDTQKLARALEIRVLTRRPLPHASSAAPLEGFNVLQIGLNPERSQLVEAIASRTRQMFERGLVEEVRTLLRSGLTGGEKPFESVGYQQTLQHLRGELSMEDARLSTEIATRQYAKRQMTWFRRDERVRWLDGFGDEPAVAAQVLKWVAALLD
jgi:tRNA dimethylallyltransferase